MKKNKLYILITISVLIFLFTISGECFGRASSRAKDAAQKVGESTHEAIESIKQDPTVEENETAGPDGGKNIADKSADGASEQPAGDESKKDYKEEEKVEKIVINGPVQSPEQGRIYLYIDLRTNILEGRLTRIGWYEDVEVSGGGDESGDHFHKYRCLIIFEGTIWGKIDENGAIYADAGGYSSVEYGYEPETFNKDERITAICKEAYNNKPDSFQIRGNFSFKDDFAYADGRVLPDNYDWYAVDDSGYGG